MHKKRNFIKILVVVALFTLSVFLYGFIKEVGIGHPVLFVLLTTALGFKILKALFEWYHYAGLKPRKLEKQLKDEIVCKSVDIFTTACPGEPYEMFEETLKAMVAITYPHKNYLCDEGNDPALKRLCAGLGVIHVTRSTHENAKAGNINNALAQSTSEFCVILDPDHIPNPDFLDHVLDPFDDPKVGYVQVIQAYYNQSETFVARAAAEQTYMFYGPYMEAMDNFGTAQAIGANCTFRRTALDSIGGHAPGLTEDMHTSMLLHAKGWESVYVPKILSRGLVPSSISAYYSQQLKWSRGTFDLWINLFPRLFKNFSWRQNIHYGLMPIYYLFGLIALIDIAVPIYSLITGEYPWLLDPLIFFAYLMPFLVFGLILRLYAQNWLHDSHEHGIHVFGGLLRVGTWWVYIVGFIYTLLNIKVPYIPTPKEYTSKNEVLLGLPNLVVAIISLGAALYGLNQDWQPYSFLMACFAISNAIIFFLAFAIGQTRLVLAIRNLWKRWKSSKYIVSYQISYYKFSKVAAPVIIVLLIIGSISLFPFKFNSKDERELLALNKEFGGFYLGINLPSDGQVSNLALVNVKGITRGQNWSVMATRLAWSPKDLPINYWEKIIQQGALPMISWEPTTAAFEEFRNHPELSQNQKVFYYIQEGYFDNYIDQTAIALRNLGFPVFLNFAPEMDDPAIAWSETGGNTPEEFIKAWRYVHDRFEILGVQNITWVWNPSKATGIEAYFPSGKQYPESRYVDWIGIRCVPDDSVDQGKGEEDFTSLYQPFQEKIQELGIGLPIMLTALGSASNVEVEGEWTMNSLRKIKSNYPEIKSAIVQSDTQKIKQQKGLNAQKAGLMDWFRDKSTPPQYLEVFPNPELEAFPELVDKKKKQINNTIKGSYGGFSMEVDGKKFYMQGVCYSSGDEWREGYFPLSRKQLQHDFKQIKEMGANTIRRYEPSIYDRNILKVAEQYGLKVMYGFWFDPTIDYYKDKQAVKAYENKVLYYVRKYKDEESILAWNIGNETWGLMKKSFEKPYLTLTRRAYLIFLEGLAQKIHEIDPSRPVFSTEEHEYYQMASTLYEMATNAPSLDVIGINSYYKESIEVIKEVVSEFDTLRPYAVTEFGPKGYWSPQFGDYWNDTLLIELSDVSKAVWIKKQWIDYIKANKGFNLGGFAFSWRDRYEGTATWFGLTDYKGRLKPAYHYLQAAWAGEELEDFPELSIVGHWYPIGTDDKIWLTAAITNSYNGKLSYEWEVIDDKKWNTSTKIISTINDYQIVEIEAPSEKSTYRVYVHAVDRFGNVITSSRPLLLK
jgi:cellulose synthase/poly-beta-1,6-N-acetylglucosamine synthase-like glycosyltransferase